MSTQEKTRTAVAWDRITLSDPETVARLISARSKLDQTQIDIHLVYSDLETLIKTACLTKEQMQVVRLLMLGFAFSDIAERFGCDKETASAHFKRALLRITRRNGHLWEEAVARNTGG